MPPVAQSFYPPNATLEAPQIRAVDDSIRTDLERGRMAGPFDVSELERATNLNFRSNPISAAKKDTPPDQPQRWRLVENLSYPYKMLEDGTVSINSLLDSTRFPSRWTKLVTFLDFMRRLPPGSMILVADLEDAFKQLSIRPEQRPFHALIWRGKAFFRKTPSFGGATTPGVFGRVVDATLDAIELIFENLITTNIVDDLLFARVPPPAAPPHELSPASSSPSPSTHELLELIDDFGWRISKEKLQDWGFSFIFGGLGWRSNERIVYLPTKKAAKYARRLRSFIQEGSSARRTLKETLELLGTLCYITTVFPIFRPFLRPLLEFRRRFPHNASPFTRHKLGSALHRNLSQWLGMLDSASSVSLLQSSYNLPSSFSPSITWTDASPDALGVVIDQQWYLYQPLVDRGKEIASRLGGIVAAEGWGIELALSAWVAAGVRECALAFASDNAGVVLAWAKGRSTNRFLNDTILRLLSILDSRHLYLVISFISTSTNPADGPSRGIFDARHSPFPLPVPPAPGTLDSSIRL